ncbi:MAG: heparan-alpha-glucosaminide N-acetyltransferase domain-containing protein [Bacteroidia bacterium]
MKERSYTADLMKGAAVLLMIQVHILELFADNSILNSNTGKILMFLGGPPVAPVFALILGYFIAASDKTTLRLIARAGKVFGLGLLLNIALNFNLIVSVNKGLYSIDLLPYIFGVDILPFAGISIFTIAILRKLLEKNIIIPITLIFIVSFLGTYLLNFIPERHVFKYLTSVFYGSCSWSYFPLFPWLAYPLAGFTFYRIKKQSENAISERTQVKIALGVLLVFIIGSTLKKAIRVSNNLDQYYHHGLLFFLWVISFLSVYGLFASEVADRISENIFVKYIKWLGKNVTAIYVIQWVITGNIATEIYKTITSPAQLIVWYFAILTSSSVLAYLFLRLRIKTKAS